MEKEFFIDKEEIEEMLSMDFDLTEFSDQDWEKVNKEVERICKEKGISGTYEEDGDYEEYASVCFGVVEKIVNGK